MNLRESSLGIALVFLVGACSSDSGDSSDGSAGSPPSGSAGAPVAGGGSPSATGGSPNPGAGAPASAGTSPGAGGSPQAGAGGSGTSTSGGPGIGGTGPGAGGSPSPTAGAAGSPPAGGMGAGGSPPAGGAGGAPPGGGPAVEEPVLVTSSKTAYWQKGTVEEVTAGNADVTVNDTATKQTWTGFGGTFNEKGWQALEALSEADRNMAIKLLFDPADGTKFVYGRIPIGSSDYGTSRYTLAETAGDLAMESFSIARDKMRLIPYIKAAQALNPNIYFWGSPWTPPPWMKDNNAYDRGNMKGDAANLKAFALYLSKFVEEYGKEGIKVSAIHPQNEPGYPQDYPSCLWSGAVMADFIGNHLGPTFKERNVMADIFIGTMSNNATDGAILMTVMNNATAKQYVKGYGLQWGMIDTYNQLNMDTSMPIWQTEHRCGNYPWETATYKNTAPNDHAYGVESWGLIKQWINAGVNAYSAWNMVLDTVGLSLDTVRPWAQNALLAIDVHAKKVNITPTYYVFRHMSQFVDPGAKVVGTSGGDALAWKNPDGTIVAVIYNGGAAKKAIVGIGGKKLQFDMPANGWATVNWK